MAKGQNQLLHWVFKVGNLRKEVEDFYVGLLGMKVLRHEEFAKECDAQCNGPFARPWSKTMVGYGPEDECFVLELAFNYGITSYKKGNDFKYLIIESTKALEKAKAKGLLKDDEPSIVYSPEGYPFLLKPGDKYRVSGLALNVNDLKKACNYYTTVLGLEVVSSDKTHSALKYHDGDVTLELFVTEDPIDHSVANGRLAIAVPTKDIDTIEQKVKQNGDKIHTERVKLDTPGKATVEVVILQDRSDYEICIVGAEAFYELAKPFPGCEVIDYETRRSNGSKEHQ
ncbi:hypothetical protein MP638_003130 [Amoeboaphelidium occidentale]|nr:hypothetical protein MP638_003130 [Amoeboaphelidium occidentale]